MQEILSHYVKNFAYFKEAVFNYEKGVQYVFGKNLNANDIKASNASGKSSLFTSWYRIFDFKDPVSNDRKSVKSSEQKNSEFGISFKQNNSIFEIGLSGSKVSIKKDGKEIDYRTSTIAKEQIEKLLPITEEEFYSTVFLDSSRPDTALTLGSPSKRAEFFVSIFDLVEIDEVRKELKRKVSKAKSNLELSERLKDDLTSTFGNVKKEDLERLKVKYETQSKELSKLSDKLGEIRTEYSKASNYLSLAPLLKSKAALINKLGLDAKITYSEVATLINDCKRSIARWKTAKDDNLIYNSSVDKITELGTTVGGILSKLGMEINECKPLMKRHVELAAQLEDLDEVDEVEQPSKSALSKAARLIEKHGVEKLGELKDKFKSSYYSHQESLNQLKSLSSSCKHSDVNCPTCFSTVTLKSVKRVYAKIESQLKEAKSKYQLITSVQKTISQNEEYKKYKAFSKLKASLTKQLEELLKGKPLKDIELVLKLNNQVAELKKDLQKPELKFDSAKLALLERRYENLKSLSDILENTSSIELGSDMAYTEKDLTKFQKSLESYTEKYDAQLSSLMASKGEFLVLKEKYKNCVSIRKQLTQLKAENVFAEEYAILLEAYSNDGIKKFLLSRICKTFQDNLNKYVRFVFREPFRFECFATDKGVFIYVHRPSGKTIRTSDIKRLSGAERRMFSWLKLLALLPMLPAKKRFDTLILDEPDANLDEPMIETFVTKFLPKLQKIVPKVVVISPKDTIAPSGSKIFRVTKKGSTSTLTKEF